MQLFDEKTGWEAGRKSVRFTTARLAADPAHAKLVKPFRGLLAEWNATDQERRDADDAVVDANALVAYCNDHLDAITGRFVRQLRNDFGDNHPAVGRFFPEAPSEVISLGLESQIARSKDFFLVAEQVALGPEAKAILDEIAASMKQGSAALAAREGAYTAAARVSLKTQTWREKANAARRSLENVLDGWAIAHHEARDYPDRFFPASAKNKKAKAAKKAKVEGTEAPPSK